jgi:hypothetical protein
MITASKLHGTEASRWNDIFDSIKDCEYCVRFDLSQVVPGSPDDAVRGFVDADFDAWIPDVVVQHKATSWASGSACMYKSALSEEE